jgi:hypothetical protein
LDVVRVAPHTHEIAIDDLYAVIAKAITDAAGKSSRAILEGHDHLSEEEKVEFFRRKGKDLFTYFRKYYGDPAATAYYKELKRVLRARRLKAGASFGATETASFPDRHAARARL